MPGIVVIPSALPSRAKPAVITSEARCHHERSPLSSRAKRGICCSRAPPPQAVITSEARDLLFTGIITQAVITSEARDLLFTGIITQAVITSEARDLLFSSSLAASKS
jgi:hypothetical protein